jgi:type II secretory pathway pseudopilin PulG
MMSLRAVSAGRTHLSRARCGAAAADVVETSASGEEGYVLLAVLVLMFLMLLALTVAAPKVAMQLKHDQELETQNRARQYVRAIRLFYKKTGHYPTSIEQLEKTNNQRFLRQRYLDPLTGKDDWKLIQVGQNKTTVKGLFGKDLPGIGGGLGAVAGMQSNMGGSSTSGSSSASGSAFGSGSSFGTTSSFGSGSASGSSFGSSSSFGASPSQSTGNLAGGQATGTANASGSGPGTPGGGVQSTDATDAKGSTGPIMGIGVPKDGEAFLTVNGVSTYQEWEFLYDPRIEQLYAQNGAMGGGGGTLGTAPTSTPLGNLNGQNNPNSPNNPGNSGNPGGAPPANPTPGNPPQ